MIIAGTGHRPKRLGLSFSLKDEELLTNFIIEEIQKIKPLPTTIISGMAQGFDMALANATIKLKKDLWAYVPFLGQEIKWPQLAQERYNDLLKKAAKVDIISGGGYENWKFHKRDKAMVDSAEKMIALYDNVPKGGTAGTIKYAHEKGKGVINLWSIWTQYVLAKRELTRN